MIIQNDQRDIWRAVEAAAEMICAEHTLYKTHIQNRTALIHAYQTLGLTYADAVVRFYQELSALRSRISEAAAKQTELDKYIESSKNS